MSEAPAQTLREEIANAVSHGLGFLLALAAVFAATMVLRYGTSACCHARLAGSIRHFFAACWYAH